MGIAKDASLRDQFDINQVLISSKLAEYFKQKGALTLERRLPTAITHLKNLLGQVRGRLSFEASFPFLLVMQQLKMKVKLVSFLQKG